MIHADFELGSVQRRKKVQLLFEPHTETGLLIVTSDIQANVTQTVLFYKPSKGIQRLSLDINSPEIHHIPASMYCLIEAIMTLSLPLVLISAHHTNPGEGTPILCLILHIK